VLERRVTVEGSSDVPVRRVQDSHVFTLAPASDRALTEAGAA